MESAWVRDLTKHRHNDTQSQEDTSQSSESNQAQFGLYYKLSSSLLRD